MANLYEEFKKKSTPGEFMGVLFQSRDIAHLTHLITTSFSEHKALNKYYNSLLDLTDTLAETSFGALGRYKIPVPASTSAGDFSTHLKDLKKYIQSSRTVFTGSHLQNIIDEIVALIDKTLYLLTLK